MIGFGHARIYAAHELTVTGGEHDFLILNGPGSGLPDASEGLPDSESTWNAAVVDIVANSEGTTDEVRARNSVYSPSADQ